MTIPLLPLASPIAFSSPVEATDVCSPLVPRGPDYVHVEQVSQTLCHTQSRAAGMIRPWPGFSGSPEEGAVDGQRKEAYVRIFCFSVCPMWQSSLPSGRFWMEDSEWWLLYTLGGSRAESMLSLWVAEHGLHFKSYLSTVYSRAQRSLARMWDVWANQAPLLSDTAEEG